MKTILTICLSALASISYSQESVQTNDQKASLKAVKVETRGLVYATDLKRKSIPMPKGIVLETSDPKKTVSAGNK